MAKDRPTILQIIPRLDAGGAELSTVEIAQAVVKAGGRALVLTAGGRLAGDVTAVGGEIVPFAADAKNPMRMLANARALVRHIRDQHVDLIHARSRAPAWSALMAARQAGVPFVTTYHGAYRETNALKRAYNSVMARGDAVIANSRFTAELIAERYGRSPARIDVIHRGVDVEAFDPHKVDPNRIAALRARWGVEPGQHVILQAARLTSWKGQGVLIDAAARLRDDGRLGSGVIILAGDAQGRDGYVAMLQEQIERLGLRQQVRLVGHVEDMPAAYLATHTLVIASIEPEAFGRTAVEAAALGCPVVATDIGAPPETVCAAPAVGQDIATGWLVPPGDVPALADRLAQALALTSQERLAMAERARRHVLAHFTTKVMQRRTLAVYDRLLGTTFERRFQRTVEGETSVSQLPRQP